MASFEAFPWNISLSAKLLFLKSVPVPPLIMELKNAKPPHYKLDCFSCKKVFVLTKSFSKIEVVFIKQLYIEILIITKYTC